MHFIPVHSLDPLVSTMTESSQSVKLSLVLLRPPAGFTHKYMQKPGVPAVLGKIKIVTAGIQPSTLEQMVVKSTSEIDWLSGRVTLFGCLEPVFFDDHFSAHL